MNASSLVLIGFVFSSLVANTVCKETWRTCVGDSGTTPGQREAQFTKQLVQFAKEFDAKQPVKEEGEEEEKENSKGKDSIGSKLEPNFRHGGGTIIEVMKPWGAVDAASLEDTTAPVPWGLNRMHNHSGLDDRYSPRQGLTEQGTKVYPSDTTIRKTRTDSEGRAIPNHNMTSGNPDPLKGLIYDVKSMINVFAGMLSHVTLPKSAMTGLLSGLCFGFLHVIAPDHLGTILTLSSATTKGNAFAVGAACGLGHSFGLVFIAIVFLSLRSAVTFNIKAWEYYGNYLVGASMILCALYFIMREATFLVQHEDGTYTAQPCFCHPSQPPIPPVCQPCSGPGSKTKFTPRPSYRAGGRKENRSSTSRLRAGEGRDVRGALVGVLQGACCPLAMVGLSFLAARPVLGIVFFLMSFTASSALGTASVSVVWAWATSTGICGGLSPKFAYRMSCCLTLTLGILWVMANYCGVLEKLNYAEAAEHVQLSHLDHE